MKKIMYRILLGFCALNSMAHAADVSALSAAEKEGILLMREEEKLAHDVYQAMYQKWQHPVFKNIAQSEQNHMAVMKTLLDAYGLPDPVKTKQDNLPTPICNRLTTNLLHKVTAACKTPF